MNHVEAYDMTTAQHPASRDGAFSLILPAYQQTPNWFRLDTLKKKLVSSIFDQNDKAKSQKKILKKLICPLLYPKKNEKKQVEKKI